MGAPNPLCASIAHESLNSAPLHKYFNFGEKNAVPPQHASTCSHTLYFLQISAIFSTGSYPPNTVVPKVAFTKNGFYPFSIHYFNFYSKSSGSIYPYKSDFTPTRLFIPIPAIIAEREIL